MTTTNTTNNFELAITDLRALGEEEAAELIETIVENAIDIGPGYRARLSYALIAIGKDMLGDLKGDMAELVQEYGRIEDENVSFYWRRGCRKSIVESQSYRRNSVEDDTNYRVKLEPSVCIRLNAVAYTK